MKYPKWLESFPMRRTMRGSTPGSSTFFQLDARVQAGGNGFLIGGSADSALEPMPVTNEQQALEVFLDLWRRAQSEAASAKDQEADGKAT